MKVDISLEGNVLATKRIWLKAPVQVCQASSSFFEDAQSLTAAYRCRELYT
jgi:hypothetical protein